MKPQHAPLAASAAHRWCACPGSIRMSRGISDPQSAAAAEGTRAHALAEQILQYWKKTEEPERGLRARFREGTTIRWRSEREEFNKPAVMELWNVDQETLDNVMVLVNRVLEIAKKAKGFELFIEEHVSLEHIRPNMWGTADVVIRHKDGVHIIDYKNGFVAVPLVDEDKSVNPQLMFYAAGALKKLDVTGGPVWLEIVQPRSMEVEPHRAVELKAENILNWAENYLWEKACATDMADAPLVAGSHCRFCPAAGVCPELAKTSLGEAALDFEEVVGMKTHSQLILGHEVDVEVKPQKPVVPLNPKQLSRVLRAAPMIDAWLRECEAAALAMMERGERVDGFKLVRKRSNREWPGGVEHSRDLYEELAGACKKLKIKKPVALYGPAALETSEMLSPAKVEKLIGKEIVNAVAVKPDADVTIAAESDKREAIGGDFDDLL